MLSNIKKQLLAIPAFRARVTNKAVSKKNEFSPLLFEIFEKFKPFTMCQEYKYLRNLKLVEKFRNIPGCVVECGTWKGGMIGGIATLLNKVNKNYYLFDSYEGLPEAKEIDGEAAIEWQSSSEAQNFYDNCAASVEDAAQAMKLSGAKNFKINKGWFNETLPHFESKEPIAILRLDGDWYESTMDCLVNLYPKVADGGIIIIDDYYTWDGCSRAIHDYFSKNNLPVRIHQFMDTVAYIKKK